MDSIPIVKRYESDFTQILLRADGILVYRPRKNLVIDLEKAELVLTCGMNMVNHPVPVLVHMKDIRRVSRDARALFASEKYTQLAAQSALLVSSPVNRVIGNFFIGLNKPFYPLRLFEDESAALAWLQEFIP